VGQGSRMRIGMITPWKVRCGIATYSKNLTHALAQHGVETYVVRLNRFGHKTPEYFEHLATRRIPDVPIIHMQHEYGLYTMLEETFYRALKALHPDVKIITTVHGIGMKLQDAIIAEHSDLVIVHNKYQQRMFEHKSIIIPHGVTPREPTPGDKAKEIMGVDGPTVGCFGFISPYKGIEDLLYAARHLKDITFIIAGGYHIEAETRYIAELKRSAPNNVVWTGFVSDKDLPHVIGAMDICVYPSRFISESGALLTLVGFGKPIIARNLPPNREKPFVLFEGKNHLIEQIINLMKDESMRNIYAARVKNYATKHSWSNVAHRHKVQYETLT